MTDMELIKRDLENHAKSISALTEDQRETRKIVNELLTDREVRKVVHKNINEKLDRIETIGRWLLMAFASVIVAALANFIIRGGLFGPPLS